MKTPPIPLDGLSISVFELGRKVHRRTNLSRSIDQSTLHFPERQVSSTLGGEEDSKRSISDSEFKSSLCAGPNNEKLNHASTLCLNQGQGNQYTLDLESNRAASQSALTLS